MKRCVKTLWLAVVAVILGSLCLSMQANAHEIRPGLLDIKERDTGWFDVTWKVPTRGNRVLAITPILPGSLKLLGSPSVQNIPGAQIQRATYKSNGQPLTGQRIVIDGLSALQTDVLLHIQLMDGTRHSAILRPGSPEFTIPLKASKLEVAGSYWRMGVIHILEGIDHLLFVLALVIIVPTLWMLVKTITAFTVAHSITLALATLGFVHVPPGPTEAVIALSIVFLAVEIVHTRQGKSSFAQRYPWIVAMIFGLFHGLGFAGALSEVGLPEHEIPLALLMFNVGVEFGQIAFVLGVLCVIAMYRFICSKVPAMASPISWQLVPYMIGCVAAFWTIERTMSFL